MRVLGSGPGMGWNGMEWMNVSLLLLNYNYNSLRYDRYHFNYIPLVFSPIGSPLGRYFVVVGLSCAKISRYVAVLLMLGMVLLTWRQDNECFFEPHPDLFIQRYENGHTYVVLWTWMLSEWRTGGTK